ncbi:UNVERIFIED_CONTAM: hypothetical protein Cloal_3919 [Acetivibrio alkalicellulosi]
MKKYILHFIAILFFLLLLFNFTYAEKLDLNYEGEYYSLSIPAHLGIYLLPPEETSYENTVFLVESTDSFIVTIYSDTIDDQAIKNMRTILGDHTSSNEKIFEEIHEYKKSYFRAMQEYSKNNFFFGDSHDPLSESYIKVFTDQNQMLFGKNSNIIIYNTIASDSLSTTEETNINISIPSFSNMSIYSINIAGKKGFLTRENIQKLSLIIQGLKIPNLPKLEKTLDIFYDSNALETINRGIYPTLNTMDIDYVYYVNQKQNYIIRHPSSFIPYLRNSMANNHDYWSFKIDYNNYYSISVQDSISLTSYVSQKIKLLNTLYADNNLTILTRKNIDFSKDSSIYFDLKKENIDIEKYESLESHGYYIYLKYQLEENYGPLYVNEFYTLHNGKVYTISLNSRFLKPSSEILSIFFNIVSSLRFIEPTTKSSHLEMNINFNKFVNEHEGYSFIYPDNWTISNIYKDINFDLFQVISPEYSGYFDMYVNEAGYFTDLSAEDVYKYITGVNKSHLEKYFKNYNTPYSNQPHIVLNHTFAKNNNELYIYKLVNYLDELDRYKLCYSVSIIRNNKVYSMFISINDFSSPNNFFYDDKLQYIINKITNSFKFEYTDKYKDRLDKSENRNRKIVFIENSFRENICASAQVTYAKILNSQNDVLVYLDSPEHSGSYRINLDYYSKELKYLGFVSNDTIEKSAINKLVKLHQNNLIHNVSVDISNMIITIDFSSSISNSITQKSYHIQAIPHDDNYSVHFIRKHDTKSVMLEIQKHLENYYLTPANLHFPEFFTYIVDPNKYYYEKSYIEVYAELKDISGFFILEIDPVKDSIITKDFTPFP